MITIPNPIKYEKDIHSSEVITKALDPNDLDFIRSVLANLKRAHAEAYIIKYGNGRIAICRKGLTPAKIQYIDQHQFFALKNNDGKIISNGKNVRRPETMIGVLRGILRRSPIRSLELTNSTDHTTAERCSLFGYTLVKQSEPFE